VYLRAPPDGARERCRSSVVEHSLGKGEVESSILSGSTIIINMLRISEDADFTRSLFNPQKLTPRGVMQSAHSSKIEEILKEIHEQYVPKEGWNDAQGFKDVEAIKEHCRSLFEHKIFVSHTSLDVKFCDENLIPILKQFGLWGISI
jgi:hypothetical protein